MKGPLGRIMVEFAAGLGRAELLKLDFYSSRAVKQQERNLRKLMKQNKNTEYGKLHNFKDVKTVDDYRRIVPYSSYPDYIEYIDRMAEKGEKNLITKKRVRRYNESSGSTGKSKLVPMSDWGSWVCQCYTFSAPVGCAYNYFRKQGKRMPPQKGLLTIEVLDHKTPSGQTAAGLAAHPMLFVKPMTPFFVTSPKEVMFPKTREPMDMHYMKLRWALECEDVSYMSAVFITMLEAMFFYLENNWEMLCDDIEKGIINERIVCPPDVRKRLQKKLKP
ncbi:MAG: GH3 auxin-responsive promoter family protein, partial [Clostridia bacterium]|nr:GH3 auxin-responsive promoter family protein [Clostridia bacterium]